MEDLEKKNEIFNKFTCGEKFFEAYSDFTLIVFYLINLLLIVISVMVSVAFYTLAERKIMGGVQRRKGPNVVGFYGFLQPFADGFKLFLKEIILPTKSNLFIFIFSPIITLTLSLLAWVAVPLNFDFVLVDINLTILYFLAISSLGVFGIIGSGWASNSKYAFLGAVRSAAQMISYEVAIGFIFIIVAICSGSYNVFDIVLSQKNIWYIFPLFPLFIIFFISALAETNRAPFDLPEAEAEIVAGYNVEYSSILFALFFLGEYANMLLMSYLTVILFFGGWLPFGFIINLDNVTNFVGFEIFFIIKFLFFVFLFVLIRSALPRVRYDQLMNLGWKIFLPLTLGLLLFVVGFLDLNNGFPLKTDFLLRDIELILKTF